MLRASCQAAGASLCSELVTESGGRKNTTGEIERLVYMKKKITSRLLVSEVQISTDMEAIGWWGWGIMSLIVYLPVSWGGVCPHKERGNVWAARTLAWATSAPQGPWHGTCCFASHGPKVHAERFPVLPPKGLHTRVCTQGGIACKKVCVQEFACLQNGLCSGACRHTRVCMQELHAKKVCMKSL